MEGGEMERGEVEGGEERVGRCRKERKGRRLGRKDGKRVEGGEGRW